MIRLVRLSKEKLINLRKSRYDVDMTIDHESKMIEIIRYKPHKRLNYDHFMRFINHETLHLLLRRKFGREASIALDNLENTKTMWVVN